MKIREAIARELFSIEHPFEELIEDNYYRKWGDDVERILAIRVDGCRLAIVKDGDYIDIPDSVFFAPESRACGFSKRSFLNAGWVQEVSNV